MNHKIRSVFAILLVLASGVSSQEAIPIDIAFVGTFRGEGPFPSGRGDWLAVVEDQSEVRLVSTTIEVTEVPDICAATATRISSSVEGKPLLLLRGLTLVEPGPVDSVVDVRRFIYPGEYIPYQLESGRHFGFRAFGSALPVDGGQAIDDYKIQLNCEGRTQVLAEFSRIGMDGPPQLVWAGDLDRDDEPDALFDLARSYAGDLFVLFLSSRATGEQLVERVAEFPVGGC